MRALRFVWEMYIFVPTWLFSRGISEWFDVETGEVERWPMGYRTYWRVMRPRYNGLLRDLPCGCRHRFSRVVWVAAGCERHGGGREIS